MFAPVAALVRASAHSQLQAEIDSQIGDRVPDMDDIKNLRYTQARALACCFEEGCACVRPAQNCLVWARHGAELEGRGREGAERERLMS
eukprot:6172583-Pleurochrysis_carterae.AAC.2